MEKFVLIDGNSLLNRAYYATPVFTTKDGFPTNAIFGFVKLMIKIIQDKNPEYIAVAFDLHAPTFRHQLYSEYKAGRKPMPEDLAKQIPVLKELLTLMKVKICELKGYEADDIIGTLSKRFHAHSFVYTGDRDAYQLVDEKTSVCFTKRGVTDLLELNDKNFKEEIGLNPKQIIDLKALMGDSSDNIPGVKGIGEKSARTLLENYQTIDGVYANVDQIKGATQTKLIEGKESAYFSYRLATIDTNVPLDVQLSDCVCRQTYLESVKNKFKELEFKSLIAMPIFDEIQDDNPVQDEREELSVNCVQPQTVACVLNALQNSTSDKVFCVLEEKSFRLYVENGDEFTLCFKQDLLDVGFFESEIKPLLQCVFEGKKTVVVFNHKETSHRLQKQDVTFSAPFEDVSLMKYIAEGLGVAESLDYCLDFRNLPIDKKAYGVYCLFHEYANKLNDEEKRLYKEIEAPLSEVLFEMERQGVCVDEKIIEELSNKYSVELSALTDKIHALAGEEFNINSPVQLGKVLFEKLQIAGVNTQKSKTKKSYGTSAEILEKYADEYEIVRQILRYRQVQKLRSTYLEGFKPLIKNGKVHTTYNQIHTTTGRLSSANPNLQNIPVRNDEGKELRKIFQAEQGNVLIDADYSQIELRLLAHFSGSEEMKKAYNEGEDVHTITASQVFGVAEQNVTPDMRRHAKAVNFGIIYGISSFGLSKDLGISTKQAKSYIDKYFETYSAVKTYMDSNVENAKRDGYVKTLCGRRRVINELKSSNFMQRSFGERAAMNMPLQGSSADIIKIAMINVSKRLKEGGYQAKLVLQVHDELIIDCPISEKDEVKKILKTEMENAVSLNVPLTVEVGEGKNWFDAH